MKRIFKSTVTIILYALFLVSLFSLFRFKQFITTTEISFDNRTYINKCTAVDIKNNILILESVDGMTWEWKIGKSEHFQKYQVYDVSFNSFGTPGLRDDIILAIE